ncbi:MAG: hypothetical protein ACJA0X_001644, partial [Cyclobacteriaceae bacterium]
YLENVIIEKSRTSKKQAREMKADNCFLFVKSIRNETCKVEFTPFFFLFFFHRNKIRKTQYLS